MSYSTGMMDMRVMVAKRATNTEETFGKAGQPKYEWLRQAGDHGFWASEKFDKGMKSLREGAMDSYNTVMFRMRYVAGMDEWCLIQFQGKWYQITSFNDSYRNNEIQVTAVRMANQKVTIVEPTPEPESNSGTTDGTTPDADETGATDETTPDADATETGTNTPVNPEPQNEG